MRVKRARNTYSCATLRIRYALCARANSYQLSVTTNHPCPMPNAPCPMPNAQCPMPNAQCPMPHAQSPILKNNRCNIAQFAGNQENGKVLVLRCYHRLATNVQQDVLAITRQ